MKKIYSQVTAKAFADAILKAGIARKPSDKVYQWFSANKTKIYNMTLTWAEII